MPAVNIRHVNDVCESVVSIFGDIACWVELQTKKLPPMPARNQVGQLIKNYKLGEVLGKGNNGTVYRSLNMDTGDVVAIKQVPLANIPKEELAGVNAHTHKHTHTHTHPHTHTRTHAHTHTQLYIQTDP